MKGESVGLIFGRFNPPHRGHRAAWEMAAQNDHWYVGTNRGTQGKKDPLPYDVKIHAMEAVWPPVAEHITPSQSWLTLASEIYSNHGEVVLKIYTDEAWVIKALDQYNGVDKPQGHGYYKFMKIQPVKTPRLSSATELREAVKAGDEQAFYKAAGVDPSTVIAGKSYFDLVAQHLMPYFEARSDKYNYNPTNRNRIMKQLNEMRKLAGLPVLEAAPVDYYGMSEQEKILADVGRLLIQRAEQERNDALSNTLAELGSGLADGTIADQSALVEFIKGLDGELAKQSTDAVKDVMASYSQGERADIKDRNERRAAEKDTDDTQDDTFASDFDDTEEVPELEPDDEEVMDSVDFSDIRKDYGVFEDEVEENIHEAPAKCEQCGREDCTCPPGECDCEPVQEAAESEVQETVNKATDAAMAELRKLAGI